SPAIHTFTTNGTPFAFLPAARLCRLRRYTSPPVDRRAQAPDVGQIAVSLGVVEAVTDHEFIGDVESDVFDLHIYLHGVGLTQQRHDVDAVGVAGLEILEQPVERETAVDDVFDDEDVLAGDVAVEVFEDAHDARTLGRAAVAADGHELHRARALEDTG